jgi:predicted O-methyltransferase YrrM
MDIGLDPNSVKGFLAQKEGAALYRAGLAAARLGPLLEIGSYCGKSALYLGAAARDAGTVLYSVDHHRGSEEHQPGQEYFDPDLWDAAAGRVDTLPEFRRTIARAGLERWVVPVVKESAAVARAWREPLGLLFIDGGHTMRAALADWRSWAGHVALGGTLAIHDVFPNPEDGGRPPHEIYLRAIASGLFEPAGMTGSLALLSSI